VFFLGFVVGVGVGVRVGVLVDVDVTLVDVTLVEVAVVEGTIMVTEVTGVTMEVEVGFTAASGIVVVVAVDTIDLAAGTVTSTRSEGIPPSTNDAPHVSERNLTSEVENVPGSAVFTMEYAPFRQSVQRNLEGMPALAVFAIAMIFVSFRLIAPVSDWIL